jgi:hypothetical protein
MDGLYEGLMYCLRHRDILGANARQRVMSLTWNRVAERMAEVYRGVMEMKQDVRPHRIDPVLYGV